MNYFGAIGRGAFIIIINCFTLSLQYSRIVSELKTIYELKKLIRYVSSECERKTILYACHVECRVDLAAGHLGKSRSIYT